LQPSAYPFDAGPYVRLQSSLGLIQAESLHVRRRAVMAALLAWLPLLILSSIDGRAIGATRQESMLMDIAVHARYLLALPLLVIAESVTLPFLATLARHFGDAGLVASESRARYTELLESTRKMLASPRTDVAILLLAYLVTLTVSPLYPPGTASWVRPIPGTHELSLAGWWRALVSQPLFLLLVFGWLWRVALWGRFLYGISQLQLRLIPPHPDRAVGIGFAGLSLRAFLILALAFSIPIAGAVATEVLNHGRSIVEFKYLVAGYVIAVILLFTAPLFTLAPLLLRARTRGILEYETFATELGRRFEQRWLSSRSEPGELGAPDFSATADLFAVTANVREMRMLPLNVIQILMLALAALLPFLPVLIAVMPLKDVLRFAAKLVL